MRTNYKHFPDCHLSPSMASGTFLVSIHFFFLNCQLFSFYWLSHHFLPVFSILKNIPPQMYPFTQDLFVLTIKLLKIICTLVSVSLPHFHSLVHYNMLHGSHSVETVFAKDTKVLVAKPCGSFSVLNFIVLLYAFMHQALDT